MSLKYWSWIGACSTGSSHIKAGTGCQDFAACIEVPYAEGTALIAVVSDGAGSAQFSSIGSRSVVRSMARQFAAFVRRASALPIITEDLAREWLDDGRDRISAIARAMDAKPRDFAATLVAAVVLPSGLTVCHRRWRMCRATAGSTELGGRELARARRVCFDNFLRHGRPGTQSPPDPLGWGILRFSHILGWA
jgi:Protein phosphatase 2C